MKVATVDHTVRRLSVGPRIAIEGTTQSGSAGPRLVAEAVTVFSSLGEVDTPLNVSAAEFTSPSRANQLNGLLVSISNLTLESQTATAWSMSEGVTVGSRVIGTLPAFSNGQVFSATAGIADTLGSHELLPRSSADVVP